MRELLVGVVTHRDDVHGLLVGDELVTRGVRCEQIEFDSLWDRGGVSWPSSPADCGAVLTRSGTWVPVSAFDVIWWRRIGGGQAVAPETDEAVSELLANDSRAALLGALLADFRGRWVSDPFATAAADHKILQLRVASEQGLEVPRTIVSQDPAAIRNFCREARGRVIAKPVKGTTKRYLQTEYVTPESLPPDASLRVSPVIYQDCVEGRLHLRVNVFGSAIFGYSIETDDLDWRRDLRVPIAPFAVAPELGASLIRVLRELRLRMGVFDLKVSAGSGKPVFLEVNSQGQFLFLQGICGTDLAGPCATFLKQEAMSSRGWPDTTLRPT